MESNEQNKSQTNEENQSLNSVDNNENNDNNEDVVNNNSAADRREVKHNFTESHEREEDYDSDDNSDDDGVQENKSLLTHIDVNQNRNESERGMDSANRSSKRRSDETDCPQIKRIKSEPTQPLSQKTVQKLTTTIEAVPSEDPPPPDIPQNTYEFMSYLLDLNANDLECNQLQRFSMSRNLVDITKKLRFSYEDMQDFRNTFIPYILTDLWQKLCYEYNQKHNNRLIANETKHFLSIVTKVKSNKMKNGLELKCICFVRPKESHVFKFGQLITIQTAVQTDPNGSKSMINRRKYLAYITSDLVRAIDSDNQTEMNHLRLKNEYNKQCVVVEEISFMIRYSDELYLRNDAILVAQPIMSAHNHIMEARSVFKFQEFPNWKQLFEPLFNSKASGISVKLNERKFEQNQRELIQIALDIVANPYLSNSSFMAINGSKDSPKMRILVEIIRQIVLCQALGQTKVLFCSSDYNTLRNVDSLLKSMKIKTYLMEKDLEKSVKEVVVKQLEHKFEKETDPQKKEMIEQLLQYYDFGSKLSIQNTLFKNTFVDKIRIDVMNSCSVIIGRIEDLCNDTLFYKCFTNQNQSIDCCVIDDSMFITEPQLYCLQMFGIKKFVLGGEYHNIEGNQTDICRSYGLSRSFFQRYYTLHKERQTSQLSTVFEV